MGKFKFETIEKYVFVLIVLFNLIPVLSGTFFPTLDGAAHLYNSNLINTLLFDNNSQIHDFFILNNELVPNWTGHFILSLFNLFLPAFIAEKILLLFYLIGLPFAFRALIKTVSPNNYLFSYFIFPFTYSFVFFLGFYNFFLAIIFFLIALNYWFKHETKLASPKKVITLFVLITLTYFSHIFVFSLLILFIGLQILINGTIELVNKFEHRKIVFITALKKAGVLLLSSFIPLILFVSYFISRSSKEYSFIDSIELIEWIKNLRPIIALNVIIEQAFTRKIFYILTAIFIIILYKKIRALRPFNKLSLKDRFISNFMNLNKNAVFWFFVTIAILIMYFKMPNSDGDAGFVSVRLGLLFFIILIIWFSTQKIPKSFMILAVALTLYFNFKLNSYYSSEIEKLDKIALECNKASEYILPNSIVLPLNYYESWLTRHFPNYLGIDKPMVILENYEAGTGYFPINWNDETIPNTLLGTEKIGKYPCSEKKSNNENSNRIIDYVFVLGDLDMRVDSCHLSIKRNVLENYDLVYSTDNCQLYEVK